MFRTTTKEQLTEFEKRLNNIADRTASRIDFVSTDVARVRTNSRRRDAVINGLKDTIEFQQVQIDNLTELVTKLLQVHYAE